MSIDSSLWYIIGHYLYRKRYKDDSLFKKYKKNIDQAFLWLEYQDPGNDYLPSQQPTTDWQDAFPHKYGHTINTQALYYRALMLHGQNKIAKKIKNLVNHHEGISLWNGIFYSPYRWKNHRNYKEIGKWFDSLGNLLAIVFGLAEKSMAEKILEYIQLKKINRPYPARAIYPPIKKGDDEWHDYFNDCGARKPHHYLNGGIWPFIGGFYVLALIKLKRFDEAKIELEKLAEMNLKGNFPEWVNPIN